MQWSVDLHPVTGEWRIIDRHGEIVCVSLHGEQHLAKIAAAPEMFEALKEARETIRELVTARWSEAEGSPEDWTKDIDAALAKAEGRTNLADANTNPPLSDLSSLRKGAEELRTALKDCAQWLDVILAEKVIVEPENEQHIAASIARARAALVSGSREEQS